MYVFVYGSLKKNGMLHDYYLSKSKYVGKSKTKDRMLLLVPTTKTDKTQWFPAMYKELPQADTTDYKYIEGELYRVSAKTLQSLDIAESHPDFYKREVIDIVVGDKVVKAWCYFCNYVLPNTKFNANFKVS